MVLLSLPLTCVIIFISIYSYFKGKFSYWSRRDVPTLPATLPYGNFEDMGITKHTSKIIDEIYTAFKGQTPIAGAYFSIKPVAVALDLDLIRDILITDFQHFSDRPIYSNGKKDPLSVQLLTLECEKWEQIRTVLNPAFSMEQLRSIFPTIEEISNRFVDVIEKEWEHSSIIDMKDLVERYLTDLMGNCVLGVDCNSLKCPEADFRNFAKKLCAEPRHSNFVLFLCVQFPRIARFLGVKVYQDDVSDFFTETIKDTISFREVNNIHRKDLLDFVIQLESDENEAHSEDTLSKEEIVAQLFILFKAGFKTTSSTVCYALYELTQKLALQTKARDEIRNVLKNHNNDLTFEAVIEMKYINQIISETIRKYSPIPRLIRSAKTDYKVRNADVTIEKGTSIFVPVYSIHKDLLVFPDPTNFDPSRFDSENERNRHSMAFLGFGDGPRGCIGQKFARILVSISLISVLRNFELKPSHKTPKGLTYNLNTEQLSMQENMYFEVRKI